MEFRSVRWGLALALVAGALAGGARACCGVQRPDVRIELAGGE